MEAFIGNSCNFLVLHLTPNYNTRDKHSNTNNNNKTKTSKLTFEY